MFENFTKLLEIFKNLNFYKDIQIFLIFSKN